MTAMEYHFGTHSGGSFKCRQCNFVMNTKEHLQQHTKGSHGKGLKALHGQILSWPSQCNIHRGSAKCKKPKVA